MAFEEPKFEKPPQVEPEKEIEKPSGFEEEPEKVEEVGKVAEETKEEEGLSPEIQEKAEEFDRQLAEIIGKELKSGELTAEQAGQVLEQAKKLDPNKKAELLTELDKEKEMPLEEKEKREEAAEEFQETISQYQEAIDNLVKRAQNLGIEVSGEELRSYLENLRNIEPEPEEKMEWLEELSDNIKSLNEKLDRLEESKKEGKIKPEEEKQAKEDFSKIFEGLTAKMIEYIIKLTVRIAKGIIKGIVRAFSKE